MKHRIIKTNKIESLNATFYIEGNLSEKNIIDYLKQVYEQRNDIKDVVLLYENELGSYCVYYYYKDPKKTYDNMDYYYLESTEIIITELI